jgi:superoxide dismutase
MEFIMTDVSTTVKQVNGMLTEVDNILCKKIESDFSHLIELADEMAENATKFEGQGYKSFLDSRNNLVSALTTLSKDYKKLVCVLKH